MKLLFALTIVAFSVALGTNDANAQMYSQNQQPLHNNFRVQNQYQNQYQLQRQRQIQYQQQIAYQRQQQQLAYQRMQQQRYVDQQIQNLRNRRPAYTTGMTPQTWRAVGSAAGAYYGVDINGKQRQVKKSWDSFRSHAGIETPKVFKDIASVFGW